MPYLRANRDLAMKRLRRLPGVRCVPPAGSFLLWLGFPTTLAADDLVAEVRRRSGIVLGSARHFFPAVAGWARLNFGTSRSILGTAIDRVVAAWSEDGPAGEKPHRSEGRSEERRRREGDE